jgi:flavin-dependent dehydrogenase
MQSVLHAEALIIGAGPAGASLATWLAQQGWDCILVDRSHFPRTKPCAGCLSPRCRPFVKRLGLEEVVGSGQRIRFIDVQGPNLSVRFDAAKNPLGADFTVVSREKLDLLLVERARSHSVRFLEGFPVEALNRDGNRVVGAAARDREIRAKVTVVATGPNSRFLPPDRRPKMRSYQALIGWFEGLADLDPSVTDLFTAPWLMGSGWIYPESSRRVNVGVMVHADLLKASGKSLRELFERYCSTHFARRRLRGATRVGRLAGSAIRYALKPEGICGDGCLMIGEASLLTHPLTGEGISQALRSAEMAARTLQGARDAGVFTGEALMPYAQGIREMFRRNFWKARFLRNWIDRPLRLSASVLLTRHCPGLKPWIEGRLNRFVL